MARQCPGVSLAAPRAAARGQGTCFSLPAQLSLASPGPSAPWARRSLIRPVTAARGDRRTASGDDVLRTLLLTLMLLLAGCAPVGAGKLHAATWHVATTGSDSNPGTAGQPFGTWQRAIDRAAPGDTILIRPGLYRASGRQGYGARITQSGTKAAPITLRGDGGRPTLDCSRLTSDRAIRCLDILASWWRIADIAVTGGVQRSAGAWVVGIHLDGSSYNLLERFATFGHAGPGILVTGHSRGNQLVDCDAFANFDDRTQPPGEHADGIQFAALPASATGNRVSRCRAWDNADDGFDLWQAEAAVTIEDSWAFRNGYRPGTSIAAGNGNGFKLGRSSQGPKHRIMRNVAFENRLHGFVSNGASGRLAVVGNTAYANRGRGFSFPERVAFRLRHNLAHQNAIELSDAVRQQANSWQVIGSLGDGDFASLDSTGVDGMRGPDGAWPELAFLRPAAFGRLVSDAGRPGLGALPPAPEDVSPGMPAATPRP
jgi:hypothetical protein